MSDNGNIGINNSGTYVVSYWDPETKTWKYYADDELGELRRDNLKLSKINENGTISEMIKTIDENFRNIAAHGGGPAGFDGMDGINGADGTSAEYIFALCDEELEAGTHYPTTDQGDLFDSVEFAGSTSFPSSTNKKIEWFDHPQGVSKEHKNEYVFSRYKRTSGENIWFYAEKPELWAHWGETGKDGDGVEYIFMRSETKLDENILEDIIKSKKSMSGDKYQPVIYQMDGFFPGEGWFKDDKNKTNVWKAINAKYGEDSSYSEFNTLWENKRFNMIVPGYDWTDEPKGTDPIYVYEYVAIRRCNVDDEDRKEWGDFSTPAIWSHYGLSTRTIIIYCNIEDTTSPVSPQTGQGIWNESEGKLTLPDSLVKAGWKDTNETPSETQITWMCSGIFDNSGKNVSWSKPMRITGKDGKQGEDGTTVEFIYALSKDMPAHPTIERETTDSKPGVINTKEELFDAAKNANTEYDGQVWYDRAQPISPDKPTEYVWSRRRDKESEPWEYDDEPIIWAHWGEDGTDGDGVEYIFYITNTETFDSANNPPKVSAITGTTELDKCKKLVYNMDDFYPNEDWFTKNELEIKKEITDAGYNVSNYDSVKAFFSKGWSDNPIKVSPMSPYQWVSIRRSHTDETTGGKRQWEDFSNPVLWNSYGKSTRTFIVYCNVSDGVLPPTLRTPVGGFWNVSTGELVKDEKNLETPYTYDALASGVTDDDRKNHINIWEDNNKDVDDKIAWMSSAIFGDDGKIIGEWSAPFRITGHNGENGADGSNIEYIYALCDDEVSLKYPQNGLDSVKNTFFNNVESKGTEGFTYEGTTWYDHPQGVSNENGKRTEWVWSRSKPAGDSKTVQWKYAPSAVKWSHWGEDGTDGDGVEYIFYVTNDKDFNTPPIQQSAINTSTQNGKYQKALFQVDDFYPGTGFFKTGDNNKKRDRVKNEISSKVNGFDETYFNNQWASANPFGLASNWTDNPTGTGPTSQYEFVSIRRFTTEDVSGKKTWGEFGKPKLWSSFSIRTRVFIVYCNIPRDITAQVQTPTGGYWNVTEDKLQNDSTGGTYSCNALTDSAMPNPNPSRTCVWSDTDQDVSNTITWMATGIFYEDNTTPKWSEPHRITGEDGQRGTDGSNMEFIYAISESMEAGTNYPTKDKDDTNPNNENTKEWLFDHVENDDTFDPENGDPKGYAYGDTFWYDRAQPIENVAGKRTEYAWSRYRSAGTTEWTYDPKPFVWAHWGEDGTDGDGVEYIFMLSEGKLSITTTDWNTIWTDATSDWGLYEKAIYSMDDFIPNSSWFSTDKYNKIIPDVTKIIEAKGETFDSNKCYNAWVKVRNRLSFNNITIGNHKMGTWYDNPQDLTPSNRYQYVSIRKMNNGEWGKFSYPKLWGNYNIETRVFMVYCNLPENATPTAPDSNYGKWDKTEGLIGGTWEKDKNGKDVWKPTNPNKITAFAAPVYDKTDTSKENVIGTWSDTNKDEPGKIAWLCSGTYAENGRSISWSNPFRITGADGKAGADGSNIQFIYALCDETPKYPKKDSSMSDADYMVTLDSFFDDVNASDNEGYYDGQKWTDNPQGIKNIDGHRKEWVWSRSLPAGLNDIPGNWVYTDEPVIWSHWGEDGTDGDGVEYIFFLAQDRFSVSENTWKGFWSFLDSTDTSDITTRIKKVVYSMDDFYPNTSWFNDNNKDNVSAEVVKQNIMTAEEFNTLWTNNVGDNKDYFGFNLGWTDNPQDLTPSNKYQYVSIRKTKNDPEDPKGKEWGAFSYPKLWSKYNLTQFKAFAFTSTPVTVELGNLTFSSGISGTIDNPRPIDKNHTWTDGPEPTKDKPQVWMTSATIREDNLGNTTWATPQRMTDTSEFQVEWSSNDITGNELANKIRALADAKYNFGNFFKDGITEDNAEKAWRDAVHNDENLLLTFGDSSDNAILMATCHKSNGKWSNWELVRVKGEKGDAGTSINMKTPITYEVYLDDNNYTINAAKTKFDQVKSTLNTPTPANGYLAIVYPKNPGDNGIYNGDPNRGNALYMCKYNGARWDEYWSAEQVSETTGDTHPSPNGHLILWDGDSWMDVGNIVGPAGPVSEILVKYAKDSDSSDPKIKYEFVPDTEIYTAKYVGFITYPAGERPEWSLNANGVGPNGETWNWQLFKGQDGFGYEYIFKTTSKNAAPSVPVDPTDGSWSTTPNVIPGDGISDETNQNYGWVDEPMEPKVESKYVWMCWRKYDHSTQKWTDFQGNSSVPGKARLWQVYTNSINEVKEYFHADTSISPNDKLFDTISATKLPDNWNTFWHTKSDVIGTSAIDDYKWSSKKAYLFNREVITYTDGTVCILDSHFVATYADKIKDVDDFYILEPANGTNNDNDPGEHAPCYNENTGKPEKISGTSPENAGIDYWTNGQPPKINEQYPILWNITQRVYEDIDTVTNTNRVDWSAPIVIGVYGQGANGEDSIYVDLNNEMDSIQIKYDSNTKKYKTITSRTCETEIRLYKGSKLMKIKDIDISGEDNVQNLHGITVTREYYVGDKKVTSYDPSTGFDYAKITFEVPNNAEFNNTSYKIVFTVTAIETVSPNNNIIRMTSYNLVGTTHPVVYSIVPSKSEIIYKKSGENYICEPSNITIEVKEYVGSEISSYDKYNESQAFGLYYDWNDSGSPTRMTSTTAFSISTSGKQPGDYVTFTIAVDTDNNLNTGTDGFETVLDRETVYVLREGSDGQQGVSGNGYQYKYVQYVNASNEWYGGSICSIAGPKDVDNPTFKIGEKDITSTVTSEPHGVDASHMYEWRSERFGYPSTATTSSSWSSWSDPIIIAKYFDDSNLSTMISTTIEQQKVSIAETVKGELSTELDRLNELSGYFDASGYLQCSGIQSSILSGYVTRDSLSNDVLSIGLTGVSTDESGVIAFADWIDYQHKTLATAGQSINAINGTIETFATKTELSNVTTAMDTFKADAHDKFAQMDRTVANAQFMTDEEGYLMVDIPDYSIWFNDKAGLSGAYKDTDIRNDVTWVLASISEGHDGSDSDSEIDPDTIQSINTLVPYIIPENKLYNTNTDTVVFVLKTVITNINIISQLTDIKNIIDREIIVTLNKLTGKYTIYVDSGSESESESDSSILAGICTYDEEIPKPVSDEVLVIMYATTDVSNGGENGIFSNLTWKVGVAEGQIGVSAVQGGGINRFSYVNTASLFNGPILPSYETETDKNLERIQYMLTLNQQYGYGVTNKKADNNENNENYNKYGELNTNGKLSINGLYEPINYKLIPEDETVEHIINFLKNSGELPRTITNDDEIGIGESKTYYVATNVSGHIDYTYTVSLPGANEVKYIKPYDEPMFKNKHIFIKTDPEDGFVNDNDGNRQTTAKGVSKDYYDIYITSKYDEIKLTYAYSITPGLPPEDNGNGNPSESVPLDNHVCLKLVYWYGEEPEPPVEDGLNSIVIFEAYNTAEPVDPVDSVDPTVNNEPSGSGNVSIFDNIIEPQEDILLHMKVYADCGSDLTSVDIKYKLETSNRITYTGAFGTDIIISTITEVDSDSSESDYSPKHLTILEHGNDNITGVDTQSQCNYQFDQNYPISQISTISVTTFTSYLQNIDIRLELDLPNGPGLRNNKFCYMAIPGSYDAKTLQSLSQKFDEYYERTNKNDYFDIKEGGFLNNTEFNTFGIKNWQEINTDSTSASIDLKFADATVGTDKSGRRIYSYTIIQYYPHDSNSFGFESYMTADVTSERPWYTDSLNDHNRSPFQGTNYGSNLRYLIDKITVTVKDRERTGEIPPINRRANNKKGSNDPGVKNYIEVLDTEKPYLITNVSELATISQMVSDGIACTQLITKAGEKQAVFFEQASKDGSQIYMNANDVGIESDYFTLNKKGLKLTGNLYAKNTDKNITAGVIGESSSTNDGIKFFAGINLPSTYSDSEIKNAVKKAKFYVTESGFLYAENAKISGNITANNFSASMTYDMDKDKPTQYSVKKTSIMNAERFEVTSEFSQDGSTQIAKIYISVEPEIAAGSGDLSANGKTLTNVPTLCMQYGGKNYYLTPDMWKSFDPKTYYDVKIYVNPSYYNISVENYNETFYAKWMLWVEEDGNPSNSWTIASDESEVSYKNMNFTGQIQNGFGEGGLHGGEVIPTNLLGKKVKVYLSLLTPFDDLSGNLLPTASQTIDIPNKSDKEEFTLNVTGWTFTCTKDKGWVITGPGSSN